MPKKRAHREGSVYQLKNGSWRGYLMLGYGLDGRPVRRYVAGKTQAVVLERLRLLRQRVQDIPPGDGRMTVSRLLDEWLREVRSRRRPATIEVYERQAERHIRPHLGTYRIEELTVRDVARWLSDRRRAGLSAATVRQLKAVLSSALTQAERWDLVGRNVARVAEAPPLERVPPRVLTADEAEALLETSRGSRDHALWSVGVTMALRVGEALSLRWEDLDLDAGTLAVRRTVRRRRGGMSYGEPKSRSSRRTLAIPAGTLASLKRHRALQNEERLGLGEEWEDHGLVFPGYLGRPMEPNRVSGTLRAAVAVAGVDAPGIRYHDLRHTAATLLVSRNVHPRAIMETLGHASISQTMELYAQVLPEIRADVAAQMEAVFAAARRRRKLQR